jgi:drug/metabolite transporter (DMT)-like permease
MQLLGIALASGVAILWGLADSIATLSARRQTTFMTTFISQLSGLLALAILALLMSRNNSGVTSAMPAKGIFISALTGIFAAAGYFSLYQAMERGPIAITSPLSSTSAVVTLFVSMIILHEQVTFLEGSAIAMVIFGVMLVSAQYRDLLILFKQQSVTLLISGGVRWAYVAIIALGFMDFDIGATTPLYGWFEPVFWTRIFSVTLFTLLFLRMWYRKIAYRRCLPEKQLLIRKQFVQPSQMLLRTLQEKQDSSNTGLSQTNFLAMLFAILAGVLENAAVLLFGMATRIIPPGETAAIASNYSVVAILFGIIVFREKLAANQLLAIGLVLCGLTLLALLHQ